MFRRLNSAFKEMQTNHRLKKYFIYDKVQKIWEQEIDSLICENTQIVQLNNNIITIKTAAPSWKTELGFQKSELLLIINKHLDLQQQIKDIKFI